MRRTWSLWITVAAVLTLAIPAYCGSSEVERHLREEYRGKTFVLRCFYSADRLEYDSAGTPQGGPIPGDWTSDGFVVVKKLRFDHGHLMIEAERRLVIHLDAKEFQFVPEDEDEKRKLVIDADLGSASPGSEQAEAVLSKVFVTEHEELASMVPNYWKPCVRTAGSGGTGKCRFSKDFRSIPGVAASPAIVGNVPAGCTIQPLAGECQTQRDGGNVPKAIYSPSPDFSESASKANVQGDVVLRLVVDEQGLPTNVHITQPLGYGLNEQALKRVKEWRFKPAEKDGKPVATEVEVSLRRFTVP